MKKILGILTLILLITVTACDDGEMTVKTFNFTGDVKKCPTEDNIYIKTTGSEVLIVDLSSTPLLNIAGTRTVQVSNIKYRNYSSSTGLLGIVCNTLDSADAYVLEEWTGSGNMEIITTKLPVVPTDGTISYSHTMTFLDVSLTKGDETIRIENTDFGDVTTSLKIKFRFASTTITPTQLLTCGDALYTYSSGNFVADHDALILNFAESTFDDIADETTVPLDNTNYLVVKHYTGSIGTSVLCPPSPANAPSTPNADEIWEAATGSVKIVKTTDSSNVIHYDIYLYNDVKFFNITTSAVTQETFTPTTDPATGYYYLGQYTP